MSLKTDYLKGKSQDENNPEFASLSNRLKLLDDEIIKLTTEINNNKIPFYLIGFDELIATESELNVPPEEKVAAIETKSGTVFAAIKKRLQLMKKNLELKNELANAILFIHSYGGVLKEKALLSIKSGRPLDVEHDPTEEKNKRLADLLFRLGLYPTSTEKKYVILRDIIWLEGEEAKKMEQVLAELADLEPSLQWKNAQRQIKSFTDLEEKEFAEVQKKYLELLKIRDKLVEDYKKKDSLVDFI